MRAGRERLVWRAKLQVMLEPHPARLHPLTAAMIEDLRRCAAAVFFLRWVSDLDPFMSCSGLFTG
jgi:hypothetical protein